MSFPLPPKDISFVEHVRRKWLEIIEEAKIGRGYAGKARNIEEFLDDGRSDLAARKLKAEYDWEADWLSARSLHNAFQDHAEWWLRYRSELERYWTNLQRDQHALLTQAALEGLKTILLLHGAMVLASLAVLTGQVVEPVESVQLAAKIAFLFAILGLISAGLGQLVLLHVGSQASETIRSALVAEPSFRRMNALWRYIRRFINPKMQWSERFTYSSILLFAAGAIGAAIALLSNDL